jgi:subtilase family serine protease
MVPTALGNTVTAVLGLSNVPMHTPKLTTTTAAAGSPDLTGFSPQAVAHAYDADRLHDAEETSVAVVAAGDLTGVIKNLRTAEAKWHMPQVAVTPVYGSGQAIDTTDNPLTGSVEWDLDTQMATMIPVAVKRLYVYDVATFTDPEVARAFNLFVAQDKAIGLSASLGECDYIAFLDGAMLTTDEALEEGAIQGQSSFASTGDNGYACPEGASTGVPEGPPGVSWPSSGEYTTAVGGTTLIADDKGNVSQEIAWSGGGGGISPWETAGPWTLRANPAGQTWQFTNQGGRGVPDVAAVADSTTPVLVYAGGSTPEGVGGTSVSSPVVLGLWARLQNSRGDKLGLSSFGFYRLYNKVNPGTVTVVAGEIPVYTPQPNPAPVPGFRDITVGTNGVYPTTPGYDYTTGIGVLDAAKLATLL